MSLALYCMLFGILLYCPETETAATKFVETPSTPSYAVEGEDFLLEWTYNVNGSLGLVQFFNVTGGKTDPIGTRFGPGVVSSTPKYVARFRAQATSTTAELRIQAVRLSDETTYQLNVVSSDTTSIQNNVKVIVQSPPNSIVTSNDQTKKAGDELTLKCSADGKPTPTIFWTRVSDNTNVSMPLNITGGKNEESYRCTAYNGVGNLLTKVVNITIHFPPKVILAQKVFVGREETAPLNCEVEGNPTPTISWSPCDVQNLCNKQNLSIPKVQTARANYTCTATNFLGVDSATTLLLIGGKNIYLRLSVSAECYKNVSVWETLERKLPLVFANTTQNYTGAELLNVTCGSLIFDVVLNFSIEVAEDDTISLIQNAAVDGKLGGLSVNVSYLIPNQRVALTTITTPTSPAPKSGNKTGLIVGVVLGSVAFVALIIFIVWCVRKKKCSGERKEVSDTAQGRKGKGQNGGDEVAYASASMLPHSKRPVEKASQSTGQALPMYAQVDKTKKTSNKGGAPQRQRQPGELQYAEVEHVTSGRSLPRKSSSEPIKPSKDDIVYADLV